MAEAYLHAMCHLDPSGRLATIHGRKVGPMHPLSLRELGPHLAQCYLGRGVPLHVSSGITIHPAVWPERTWVRAEAYLHAKFQLDPSDRLATVHERYRQSDRQTGQTTDR